KAQTGIGLQLAQPRADHCKAQSTGALPANIGEIQAVVSSDVNTGSRQAANVGVQVKDVTSAQPQLAVRVPLDISARCSQTSRIAGIQRVLRANAGDQVVDLDIEIVDCQIEARNELGSEDHTQGQRIRLFRRQCCIAPMEEVVLA